MGYKKRNALLVAGSQLVVLTEQKITVDGRPKPFNRWYRLTRLLDDNNYPLMSLNFENRISRSGSCVNSLHESLMDPSSHSYYDYEVEGSLKNLWFDEATNQTGNTLHRNTKVFVPASDGVPEAVSLDSLFKSGKTSAMCCTYSVNSDCVVQKLVTFTQHRVLPRHGFVQAKLNIHANNIVASQGLIIAL